MEKKSPDQPPYLVFGRPDITDAEIDAVARTLRSGWIGSGPQSREFESAFAAYQGVTHAVAVSSCTAALSLALQGYGIKKGDEVITTAMTFAATINAIIHSGATPVLVDIEPDTMVLDVAKVEAAITPRTKAVIPVHFAGAPADIDALLRLRERHGFKVIHDCAHAIETQWNGRRLATFADVSCFSFYSTKNITTIEGGMLCSEDQVFIERVRLLANHGMSKDAWKRFSAHGYSHYDITTAGFKFNFTDVQACIGLLQLAEIDKKYARREAIWKRYVQALAGQKLTMPPEAPHGQRHALHLFTLLADPARCGLERDQVLTALHDRGIGCGVHYRSIPSMTYYQRTFGWKPEHFPHAHRVGEQTFSIPLTPYLTDEDVNRVINAVTEVLASGAVTRQEKSG